MKRFRNFFIFFIFVHVMTICPSVFALSLNDEYSIEVLAQQLDTDSWHFTYKVTNNTQQIKDEMTGLDGFTVWIPENSIVSNVTVPDPYFADVSWPYDPYWNYGITSTSIWWWGEYVPSVYPIGSTAVFQFDISNVSLGAVSVDLTSYWQKFDPPYDYWPGHLDGRYTTFSAKTLGPVDPVPEPGTILLLGAGLIGLAGIQRRKFGKSKISARKSSAGI